MCTDERVDTVPVKPRPVVVEVRADRADEDRPQPERRDAEADVGSDTTAADLEVVNEKGQRDVMQLIGHQLVGEPPRKGHQVIGRDRTGHRDPQLL